jgi:membrane protease YdiL (CAAX protease family)
MRTTTTREISWFLFWLLAFSVPTWMFITHLEGSPPPMVFRMIMWCPGAAALATCAICRIPVRSLGWQWPSWRFASAGVALPWLYAVPAYVALWVFVDGAFDLNAFVASVIQQYHVTSHATLFALGFGVPTTLVFGFLSTCTWALGEELGWRGFLVPRMSRRLGFVTTGVLSGVIWAAWHYPLLLGSNYNAGTPPAFALPCFTVGVICAGIVTAWLRMASGSLWPCVFFHASHNTLVEGVLDAMTSKKGPAPYIATEFGMGMLLISIVISICIIRHVRRHPDLQKQFQPRSSSSAALPCSRS